MWSPTTPASLMSPILSSSPLQHNRAPYTTQSCISLKSYRRRKSFSLTRQPASGEHRTNAQQILVTLDGIELAHLSIPGPRERPWVQAQCPQTSLFSFYFWGTHFPDLSWEKNEVGRHSAQGHKCQFSEPSPPPKPKLALRSPPE